MGAECCKSKADTEFNVNIQSRTKEVIKKIFDSNQTHVILRIQAAMKSYLAAKRANATKFGGYQFKDFNAECFGDFTNKTVDKITASYGQYKCNKSIGTKYKEKRQFFGMEDQDNGSKYQGEINPLDDVYHGYGTMIWKDGSRYDGWWRNDKPHHHGRLIMANGDMYN